jgi:hypothetical protein
VAALPKHGHNHEPESADCSLSNSRAINNTPGLSVEVRGCQMIGKSNEKVKRIFMILMERNPMCSGGEGDFDVLKFRW